MKARSLVLLCLVAAGGQAQQNPNNHHARHHPQSPYYVGPRGATQQAAPQPAGWWQKTWGAIANSETGGALGAALGASSKREAERLSLADCEAKGGGGCKVALAYHNQCAAMVIGNDFYTMYSAASVEQAVANGMGDCKARQSGCRVYYSACTEPVFHQY